METVLPIDAQCRPAAEPARPRGTAWGEKEIRRLLELYIRATPRLSEAAIGRQMQRSKSSVHGKIWRLGLASRGTPIRRATFAPPARQQSNATAQGDLATAA
jgi:hypothetical protein